MAKIHVHAGDFLKKGDSKFHFGVFVLRTEANPWIGETIPIGNLEELSVASEENVAKVGGKLGWGLAGAALLGPIGLAAGLLAGGRGKNVTFVARFVDGRKLLATTDNHTYIQMSAVIFDKASVPKAAVALQPSLPSSGAVKACPACSAENPETSKFCNNCGSSAVADPLTNPPSTSSTMPDPPPTEISNSPGGPSLGQLMGMLVGIIGFIVTLGVVVTMSGAHTDQPRKLPMDTPSVKPETQASVDTVIPNDVIYTIIDSKVLLGTTRRLNVRLNRKVSEDVLRAIAIKLKNAEPTSYESTFILYYLPDMIVDTGAWASTHFEPDLKVKILGASLDDEKRAANIAASPKQVVIGKWLDEAYSGGQIIIIYREKGRLFLGLRSPDPIYSNLPDDEISERKSKLGRKFQSTEPSDSGDFYILDKSGNLQGWDAQGFVRTMKAIDVKNEP